MGDRMVPLSGQNAMETREQAMAARAQLARARADIERQQAAVVAEFERQKAELQASFDAQRAELEAQLGPLQDQLQKMSEVMWTVDLYLGRDETLRLLRDGDPAPADTPITVRQRVLVMAEESLVHMGTRSTGMDAENVPEFVNWLLADSAHMNRVLPEPKGLVVLIPTRVKADTGNVLHDAVRDEANQRSFWLLRNGAKVYLLTVDPELKVRDRVLPKRSEFSEVFEKRLFGFGGSSSQPVEPGSDEWLAMEKRAGALRRHYMRVMLVLQGIIDRTPVWHPLPEGGVSMLRLEDQDSGKIQLVQDGDTDQQLGDGRESFHAWQARLNSRLRPGMRVIGNFTTREFTRQYIPGDRWMRGGHPRLSPGNASYPPSNEPLLIEDRRDNGLIVRYRRTDEIYKTVEEPVPGKPGYVYRYDAPTTPTQRASCVLHRDDNWILPFDLATVDELEYYLNSRENRSEAFLTMVPTVQAALRAKREEAAAEAPFRQFVADELTRAGAEDAEALVDELVQWWKIANLWHRPLNGDPAHEKKAATEIVAEYRSRRAATDDPFAPTAVEVGSQVPDALAVVRNRRGEWFVYTASAAHESSVFVDIIRIRANGTLGAAKREQTPTMRTVTALHVAWSTPRWDTWQFGQNRRHWLTATERAEIVEQMRSLADGPVVCVTEFHDPANPEKRSMAVYWWTGNDSGPGDTEPVNVYDCYNDKATPLITSTTRRVVKSSHAVTLEPGGRRNHPTAFSHYTSGPSQMPLPWWPDDAYQYSDARPRLVWSDDALLNAAHAYWRACRDQWEIQNAATTRARQARARQVNAMWAEIERHAETSAHQRFCEDYGSDAEDLWPAHRKSIRLPIPFTLDELRQLIENVTGDCAGQTLAEVTAKASARYRITVGDYGGIIIPDPTEVP